MQTDRLEISTEIFPVITATLPQLFSFRLDVGGGDVSTIGGKLSYRLRRSLGGHWVWTSNRLVTDNPKPETDIMAVMEGLWDQQPNVFKDLRAVNQERDWSATPRAQADFVANGLLSDSEDQIRKILREKAQDIGKARIERECEKRGWVVQGHPAMSISISSRLFCKEDLKSYASRLSAPQDLIGLWVADKMSSLKGEIIEIAGTLDRNRKRLLALTQREEMREVLGKAPDNETVVRVLTGHNGYEYVVSALQIVVRMRDFCRFGINSRQATNALRMEPTLRLQLVREVSNIAISKGLVMNAYGSRDSPNIFLRSTDVGFAPRLRFGGNNVAEYDEKALLRCLHQDGLYKKSERFQDDVPIDIGVLNALSPAAINRFWPKLQQEAQRLGFRTRLVCDERLQGTSRIDLEKAIAGAQEENPHILLAFLPDEQDEEEWGVYHDLKSLTIGRGIASQVVYESTLDKEFAIANIMLGVLGKTGNIPFVLAEPLTYADLVVGIDIARERKRRLPGTINATAIARIYFRDGEFVRYVIHDAPLEGETIPENVLQSLFPADKFTGKRIVVHRDGYFRGEEKQALKSWAQKIGAEFGLVEVIKSGSPRLYAACGHKSQLPPKGSAFKLSSTEALLVSSLPPFGNATPRPLRIRTEPPLLVEQAIHSVLSLTLLHYGSLRVPRLPVTIHYSDRIAYLALRGIKPKDLEGSIPFWL